MAALSPSNLPINPAALKRAETSEGESAVLGLRNWLRDLRHHQGMPSQIREDAYALGVDLAVTPGQVVYRNEQLELIQYAAPRVSVHRRPVLLIPPQINKYYIFDLKPRNSIIGHLLRSGLQMFVVSWRNPGADAADWNLDTYVAATLDALEAIRSITRSRTLSLISACAGGFTAMALLGYLAETRQPLVRSHSLLVTALLSHNGSTLELFGTPEAMEMARERCRDQGYMDGRQLARIFAWLRPNDLVWNYWVNNYLMGRSPPPLDVLYWDNDSTRLPAGLQSDFLDMYAREVFEHPRAQRVLGVAVDYRKVKVDTYFAAGREDYLMPWAGVYRAAKLFRGRHSFVLSTSGHVQSILRPPHLARTEYFTNAEMPATPEQWQAGAQRHQGTWWDHWTHWLVTRSGALKRTPRRLGDRAYPPLAPAPGDYVRERS